MSSKHSLKVTRDRNGETPDRETKARAFRGSVTRRFCHALRIRVRGRDEVVAVGARFPMVTAIWFEALDEGRRLVPRLWAERLPFGAEADAARRRRSVEFDWTLEPDDPAGLRATLLLFDDGDADLILVADRAAFDRTALRSLGLALVGMEDTAEGPPTPAGAFEPAVLLAAIGLVLSRFDRDAAPVVGMMTGSSAVMSIPVAPARSETVADLVNSIRARLHATPADDMAGGIAIGLAWDADGAGPLPCASEYRAFLALPFPLTIAHVALLSDEYRLSLSFEPSAFDAEWIRSFGSAVEHVHGTLRQALAAGGQEPLSTIAHMSPAETAAVVAIGRSAGPPPAQASRIEDCIASQAARRPTALALSCEGQRMSYGELDRISGRMAAAMRDLGVRTGDRVGICLERSIDLVPTLLAVMKAGATYLPLDPAYPTERLAFTIADARPSLVIGTRPELRAEKHVQVLSPENLLERAAAADAPALAHGARSDDAAYVIYTSGSTGRPKGVVVLHRNVTALITATRDDFELGEADVWTLFHSSAFDFSVWEIWACLATGGHLVVVPYWTTRSPDEFLQLLVRERVSVLNQTPSAFAQLQEAESRAPAELALRLVIFGGEALDCRMLLSWFDRHPESECRLVNMYGITETTVHVTAETITRQHALSNSRAVGRPLPGWYVYVMDEAGRMLPPGVDGEIYVGGAGVADSYLNREDLTAERFLNDPFVADGRSSRMYRSGDRGRLGADGRLAHLGRLDSQVKIRGFRVELDEIRAVLLECNGVTAAAVLLDHGSGSDAAAARLDAYVVLAGGTVADIRRRVARQLPEHMVPATVTVLPQLPLTSNGKLDASRLPPPASGAFATFGAVETREAKASPSGGLNKLPGGFEPGPVGSLRRIWSEVLGVEVDADDNFFELGGNSLYAVRIASAMREGGMEDVPMRELYLRQTIRGIADYMLQQSSRKM